MSNQLMAGYKTKDLGVIVSLPRSAWKCSLRRSGAPNPYATLQHLDLLPRRSVEAGKKLVRSLLTNCTSLASTRQCVGAREGGCAIAYPPYAKRKPVGWISAAHPPKALVEYTTYPMNSQFFVQKYQLYLPEREELKRELELTLRGAGR